MKKRLLCLALALLLLAPAAARGGETPEWAYPLKPEILQDIEGYIVLTNRECLLDSGYEPEDLVKLKLRRGERTDEMYLRREAAEALARMFSDAEEAGYTLYMKSAYRSYQTQRTMYDSRLETLGKDDGLVAYPGSSDHQTGLGVDILNYEWTKKNGMNYRFAATAEAKWMEAHCQDYGYVLRYMEDKEESTGIKFEPWHFRYVGKEAAAYIMERHLSLEEFTKEWRDYVRDYEAAGGDFEALLRERARLNTPTVVDVDDDGEEEISIWFGN